MLKLNFANVFQCTTCTKKGFPSAAKCISCLKCPFDCVDFSNPHILSDVLYQHPHWCVTRGTHQ